VRAPLSWIRDFTPVDAPVDEIVGALNQVGLEVDAVEAPGAEVLGVRAAKILEVLPHPDADRLQLADVDFGDGQTRVVCGAPNIYAGMVAPFAPAGATLPGPFVLERRKIRGQVSDGMLCSPKELGLGDDHSGILELDPTTALGTDVREILGLDDVIFELAITPNRPDAMCIVGVARELAAHFRLPLTVPDPAPVREGPNLTVPVGQQSSRGIELAFGVRPVKSLRIQGNLSLVRAQYDNFTESVGGVAVSRAGNRSTNTPGRVANLWVDYAFLPDWNAGFDARAVSSVYGNTANTVSAPGYTIFGASLSRKLNKVTITARVKNLTDKVYADNITSTPMFYLGAPRTFEVAVLANF